MRKYVSFFAVVVLVLGLNARQAQAQDPTRPVLQAGLDEVLADMHLLPVGPDDWIMLYGTKALAEYRIKVQVEDPDGLEIQQVDEGIIAAVEKLGHTTTFHAFDKFEDGHIEASDVEREVSARVIYVCKDDDDGEKCTTDLRAAMRDGLVGVMPDFYGGEGDRLNLNLLYFPQLNQ